MVFEFRVNPDPLNGALDFFWKPLSKLTREAEEEMVLQFLQKASIHSTDRESVRHSVLTLKPCAYTQKTTKGQAKMLQTLFSDPEKLSVLRVEEPTVHYSPQGEDVGVLDRTFIVGAFHTAQRTVVFGHNFLDVENKFVTCDCKGFQDQLGNRLRPKSLHWCKHICFLLMKCGFAPGHAFYIQSGFTTTEMDLILAELESVTSDRRKQNPGEADWYLQNGTNVNASCAAAKTRTGCATAKATNAAQPILPPKHPRVVVQCRRKLMATGEYVSHKCQFCPVKRCVFALMPPHYDISRPPTDGTIVVQEGVVVTNDLRRKSGGLNFV